MYDELDVKSAMVVGGAAGAVLIVPGIQLFDLITAVVDQTNPGAAAGLEAFFQITADNQVTILAGAPDTSGENVEITYVKRYRGRHKFETGTGRFGRWGGTNVSIPNPDED